MSEIITTWRLDVEDGESSIIFDSLDHLADVIKEEVAGCMCCLGDELKFTVTQGEMQQHEFDALKEFESD